MGDLCRRAIEFDLHDRQGIECDRASRRLLPDQGDDGARHPFALAGQNAIAEALVRQRPAGHDTQLRYQGFEFVVRKRRSRTFDDPRGERGMGAQGEID
jgi:hypothetical protein